MRCASSAPRRRARRSAGCRGAAASSSRIPVSAMLVTPMPATRPRARARAPRAPRRPRHASSASGATSRTRGDLLPWRRRVAVGELVAVRSTTAALQAEVPTSMPEQERSRLRCLRRRRPATATRSPSAPTGPRPVRNEQGVTAGHGRPASVPAPSTTMTTAKPAGNSTEPPPGAMRWARKKGAAAAGSSSSTRAVGAGRARLGVARAALDAAAAPCPSPGRASRLPRRRSRSRPTRAGSRGRSAPAARRSGSPRRSRAGPGRDEDGVARARRRERVQRVEHRVGVLRRRPSRRACPLGTSSRQPTCDLGAGRARRGSATPRSCRRRRPRCSRAKALSGW